MAVHSIKKADYQREGVLRLVVEGEEASMTYEVIALVSSDPSRAMTWSSDGAYMPTEGIEEAVREYMSGGV